MRSGSVSEVSRRFARSAGWFVAPDRPRHAPRCSGSILPARRVGFSCTYSAPAGPSVRPRRRVGPADVEVPLPSGLLALLLQPGEVGAAVAAVAVLGPRRRRAL